MKSEQYKSLVRHDRAEAELVREGLTKRILSYDDELMVEELVFEAGVSSAMHSHGPVQIPYVKSGVFRFTVDGDVTTLREGDTAYMGPDVPHRVTCVEAGTLVVAFSPVREDYL